MNINMANHTQQEQQQLHMEKRKRGRPRKNLVICAQQKRLVPVCPKISEYITPSSLDSKDTTDTTPPKVQLKIQVRKTSVKRVQQARDRDAHNTEEKRRKARINYWIYKLGLLLFKIDAEKQSKRNILERAFNYIHHRETSPSTPVTENASVWIQKIKSLEATVIILVELLRKNSVTIPENLTQIHHPNPPLTKDDIFKEIVKHTQVSSVQQTQSSTISVPVQSQNINSAPVQSQNINSAPVQSQNINSAPVQSQNINSAPVQSQNINSAPVQSQNINSTPVQSQNINSNLRRCAQISILSNVDLKNIKLPNVTSNLRHQLPLTSHLQTTTTTNIVATTKPTISTQTSTIKPIESFLGNDSSSQIANTFAIEHKDLLQYDLCENNEQSKMNADIHSVDTIKKTTSSQSSVLANSLLAITTTEKRTETSDVSTYLFAASPEHLGQPITTTTTTSVFTNLTTATATPTNLTTATPKISVWRPDHCGEDDVIDDVTDVHFDVRSNPIELVVEKSSSTHKCGEFQKKNTKSNLPEVKNVLYCRPTTTNAALCNTSTIQQTDSKESNNEKKRKCNSSVDMNTASASLNQRFGIEKLLIENINPNVVQPISQCTSQNNNKPRSRLPSNGHTVAALLHTTDINNNIANLKLVNDFRDNATSIKTQTPTTESNAEREINKSKQTAAEKPTTKARKRWGTVIENVHSNNMLLTSFLLDTKVGNKSKRKQVKDIYHTTKAKKRNRKHQRLHSQKPSTCSIPVENQLVIPVENQPVMTICTEADEIITVTTAISSNKNTLKQLAAITTAEVTTLTSSTATLTSSSGSMCSGVIVDEKKVKTGTILTNADQKSMNTPTAKNNVTPNRNTSKPLPVTRTMKDRTIKNKWLNSEKNYTTAPSISVSTPEHFNIEQCASPVISYPTNVNNNNSNSKRKRKSSLCHMTNVKYLPIDSQLNMATRNFSAESLSRSATSNENKPSKNNRSFNKTAANSNASIVNKAITSDTITSVSPQKDTRRLRHQPTNIEASKSSTTSGNTLPTILNIFAPASVPTTANQQQTFHSAFSNFSAEALLGNECNIGVMDTNNMTDTNFNENMIMAANSQLFTNFSADTLISDHADSSGMPFAVNNLINQNNNTWNQPWITPDLSDTADMFPVVMNQQMNGANQEQRQRVNNNNSNHVTTECSPIKSIMSILNSAPNNHPTNFPFANQNYQDSNNTTIMSNVFPQHQTRFPNGRENRNNITETNSNIEMMSNFSPMNMWINRPLFNLQHFPQKHYQTLNNVIMNTWNVRNPQPNVKTVNRTSYGHHASTNSLQNATTAKVAGKSLKEKNGPTLGNFSLINSATPT